MSGNGPTKLDDTMVQDVAFLYPERLVQLTRKSQASTSVPTMEMSSIFDDSIDIDSLLPEDIGPQTQERMALTLDAVEKTLDHEAILRDFIIERAGYSVQPSKEISEEYRLKFERIILEEGEIFEAFFNAIKEQVTRITAEESAKEASKRKSKQNIIKEAREKALEELGPEYFAKLGQYYAKDNRFYFDENETANDLSNHFLTALFGNPELAAKILEAQKDKTEGQLKGKQEHLISLLPTAYNGTIEELGAIIDDLDLFLASPTIANIAKGKKVDTSSKRLSRAENLQQVHDILESGHKLGSRREYTLSKLLNKTNSTLDIEFGKITGEFARLSLNTIHPKSADQFIEEKLADFRPFLAKHGFDFERLNNLNPVEKVYVIKKHVLEYINNSEIPAINARMIELDSQIKLKQDQLIEEKKKISTQYLKDNHAGKDLAVLSRELKGGMRAVTQAIAEKHDSDIACKQIMLETEAFKAQKNALNDEINNLTNKLAAFKSEFVKTYYSQIIPVAKELSTTYKELMTIDQANKKFEQEGGTYSCLTFLPIKVIGDASTPDRYECLVAMSGAEMESSDSVNAHQLLADLSESLDAFKGFTFRYVQPGTNSLDLLLKQIGKGLSGTTEPLSHLRNDPLPVFEKACAEKRLINELIKLYAQHGQNIQVLGCDNIALPTYMASTPVKQAELEAKELAKLEARRKQEEDIASKAAKRARPAAKAKAPAAAAPVPAAEKMPEKKAAFAIEAILPEARKVKLPAEHITCCSSCQAQKPAVFTVLFDSMKRGSSLSNRQHALLTQPHNHAVASSTTSTCRTEATPAVVDSPKPVYKIHC